METWIPIVTAFGLGSIVTALVSAWLNSKQLLLTRQFEEKKEAYIGLLEAHHRAAVEPSDANSKHFAFGSCGLSLSHLLRSFRQSNR